MGVCVRSPVVFRSMAPRRWPLVVAGIAVVAVAGCATITKGTSQSIAIVTPTAPGATCTLTSPAMSPMILVSPGAVSVEKSKENINVVCRKACFSDGAAVCAPTSRPYK